MEKLTKEKAAQAVETIEKCKGDPEIAHSAEDRLREWFIDTIAECAYSHLEEVVLVALEVQKTKDIEFARWCA